jgi:alpha-D-ribose 1-methylphosphonate 5-triphosphate synthase subunit PhnH
MNTDLTPGFANPPIEAAHAFRLVLEAAAHPGRRIALAGIDAPPPCSPAAATVLLTLVDGTTPLHLAGAHDCAALRAWVGFHLGAPLVGPQDAAFALGTWDALCPLTAYPQGSAEYPDRSATLIVDSTALEGVAMPLSGPGIKDKAWLNLPDPAALRSNAALFPRGVDFLFTFGAQLAALPRSTQIGDG